MLSEGLEAAPAKQQSRCFLGSMGPCSSECGLRTGSIYITLELVRDLQFNKIPR